MRNHISLYRITPVLILVALLAILVSTETVAQTSLQAAIKLRPVTRDDISAFKLPSTTQTSAGLSNVGLGQPAYLDLLLPIAIPADEVTGVTWTLTGRPAGSNAALVDSPIPANVPPFEPYDRTASMVAARKMLKPDVQGQYTLTATVNTAKNGIATVLLAFNASTYAGIAKCQMCHSGAMGWDKVTPWSATGHSKIFKDGVNGVASDHYGPNCIACHTVGYDTAPGVNNKGFSQTAAQLGWTFPPATKPGTFEAMPAALKNLSNIQCENCHGPGERHASTTFKSAITVNTDSGTCNICHSALNTHYKGAEWNNSVHAIATSYTSGPGREACVQCHTGIGFINKVKGETAVNTTYGAINCTTCHDPHETEEGMNHIRTVNTTLAEGTVVDFAGKGGLCMSCHQARVNASTYVPSTPGSARFGPHHGTQADMLLGVNAWTYGKEIPSSAHGYVVEDTCVGCHMQAQTSTSKAFTKAGGHTFKVATEAAEGTPEIELVGACQKCHGTRLTEFNVKRVDYDGNGTIEGVQTEVRNLMDKLSSMLPPVGKPKTELVIDATWTQPQLKAAYNWLYIHDDGSWGIHNTAYTVGLLKSSINDLSPK